MKKFILFAAAAMMAAVTFAQTPTVSASSVTFKYCETTIGDSTKYVTELPFTWHGHEFTTFDSWTTTITNVRGCDSIVTYTIAEIPGIIKGEFSVSATKKIYFAKGNLQFRASDGNDPNGLKHMTAEGEKAGEWRFAEHQWDAIKNKSGNTAPSASQTDWIDMFGFGTSGYDNKMPYATTSGSYTDYAHHGSGSLTGDRIYYDWGQYNAISNGGNEIGAWRLLTQDEWAYLLDSRMNGSGANYRKTASVNGISGKVLVPDNWNLSTYPLKSTYTETEWVEMEKMGAVFFPLTGYRDGTSISETDTGCYWTSTYKNEQNSYYFKFSSNETSVSNDRWLYRGLAVRLVRDVK